MKKSLLLLPGILFVVFIFLSVIDHSDYALEKKMWRAQQQFTQLTRDPKSVPEKQFESLATQYQKLISQYPKSYLLPQIYLQIGQVYAVKGNFEKARTNFSEILKQFPNQKEICAAALFGIGSTYEKEMKEEPAVKTYQQIIKVYPVTNTGFNMPIYIANYYLKLNKNVDAAAALKEAERFYQQIILENPNSPASFNALRFLAATYLAQERWDDAVKTFEKILFDYARSPYMNWRIAQWIIGAINRVSIEKLKDLNRPILIYQTFIEKQPGHPLDKILKKILVSLQDLKNGKKAEVKK